MSTLRNFTTIHLLLNQIDVLEVVIFLLTYLIKYVFRKKRGFKSNRAQQDYRNKWIENINKTYDANVNVNLMEENIIQINGRITINVNLSVKNIMYVKKIMFGILLHVVVKMENIQQVLLLTQRLSVMKLQNHTMQK